MMLGMMVSGGVSGGHLNPAITVAIASIGKFPWWKVNRRYSGFNKNFHSLSGSSLRGSSVSWLPDSLNNSIPGLLG